MQSKPGASTVFYLNFDGYHIKKSEYPILIAMMNQFTQGGLQIVPDLNITLSQSYIDILGQDHPVITDYYKQLDDLYVPPLNFYKQYPDQDLKDLWEYVSYGLETFDINVTTDKSVYENAGGKKYMSIISFKPDPTFITTPNFWGETFGLTDYGISWKRFLCGDYRYDVAGQTYPINPEPIPVNFIFDSAFPIQYQIQAGQTPSLAQLKFQNPFFKLIKSKESIAHTILHEFGHLSKKYGMLHHDGQGTKDYYDGHNGWFPIMGRRPELDQKIILDESVQGFQSKFPFFNVPSANRISQWSKGEYQSATQTDDDINILGKRYKWNKEPYNKINPEYKKCYDGKRKARSIITSDFKVNTNNVHTYLDSNTKTIEGMIGYSYDFDILKIILKKGRYKFEITTSNQSPFDPKVEILRCVCERKSSSSITCNKVGENFPQNIENNFSCINYVDCDPKSSNRNILYPGYRNYKNENVRLYSVEILLDYTTLLYLKISGNKKPDSEPPDPNTGYTPYGSIGKYFLEIKKTDTSDAVEEDFACTIIPPAARCEKYDICDGKKVFLLVQDNNMAQEDGNDNEAHIIEQSIIINGKISPQERRFLVYGPAIEIDATEEEGKLYFQVIIDNQPKKQEFIVSKEYTNLDYDSTEGSV